MPLGTAAGPILLLGHTLQVPSLLSACRVRRTVTGRPRSSPILLVADLLHPIHASAVDHVRDGDMAHAVSRGGSMPMLHARRRPDDVTWLHLQLLAAPFLHPSCPGRDDQDLASRMGMPG